MYAYSLIPIDFGWDHLKTVNETISNIAQSAGNDRMQEEVTTFLNDWSLAQEKAKKLGWEGDFRGEPRVFWLPFESELKYGFVFKQDNNGDTFVVSPVDLPYLN